MKETVQAPAPKTKRPRGSGSVIKLSGSRFWYILYYVNGKQRRESSQSESRTVAEQLLRRRIGESTIGIHQPDKKLTYSNIRESLLLDYRNSRNKSLLTLADGTEFLGGLKHLDAFFEATPVSRIDSDLISRFIRHRQDQGAQPSTINRSLALLRRMLNLAKRHGKIQNVPYISMQKENPARKGFVTNEQFRLLFEALPDQLKPLILFLYFTGCRLAEALKIQWSQVNLDAHQIRLEGDQTKSSEPRILPLTNEVLAFLRAVPVDRRAGQVFQAVNLRKDWEAAVTKAGFPDLLIHDLRRSAVRNLMEAGVSENVAMKISGHKTQYIFRRYHIVSTTDIHNAMNRVQAAAKPLLNKAAD